MVKGKFFVIAITMLCMGLTSCGGDDSGDMSVGSVSQTTAEIDSLNLATTTVPIERLFNTISPADPSISFSLSSIELESNIDNGDLLLSTESPMRISAEFANYQAVEPNSGTGIAIVFMVTNYTAEQFVSDSLPAENRRLPIGTWVQRIDSTEGVVTALCRAVIGDFGVPAYNCRQTFDVQGFTGINDSFTEIGATDLHLLITVRSTTNLSNGGLVVSSQGNEGPLSFVTSVPIRLD